MEWLLVVVFITQCEKELICLLFSPSNSGLSQLKSVIKAFGSGPSPAMNGQGVSELMDVFPWFRYVQVIPET